MPKLQCKWTLAKHFHNFTTPQCSPRRHAVIRMLSTSSISASEIASKVLNDGRVELLRLIKSCQSIVHSEGNLIVGQGRAND